MILAGCSSSNPQLPAADAAADAPVDAAPTVQLTTPDGTRPLVAYYSIFLQQLAGPGGTTVVELVVTLADPAFDCSGSPAAGVDEISFTFRSRVAPTTSQMVLARNGPHLGPATGGMGRMDLSVIDARYQGESDGGADVAPGGHVEGHVQYSFDGGITVSGDFSAPHCALLDFSN